LARHLTDEIRLLLRQGPRVHRRHEPRRASAGGRARRKISSAPQFRLGAFNEVLIQKSLAESSIIPASPSRHGHVDEGPLQMDAPPPITCGNVDAAGQTARILAPAQAMIFPRPCKIGQLPCIISGAMARELDRRQLSGKKLQPCPMSISQPPRENRSVGRGSGGGGPAPASFPAGAAH